MSFYVGQKVVVVIDNRNPFLTRPLVKGAVEKIIDIHLCTKVVGVLVGIGINDGEIVDSCKICGRPISTDFVTFESYYFAPLEEKREVNHNFEIKVKSLPQPVPEKADVPQLEPVLTNIEKIIE